jgi:peptidyl-prolyl cis-trans isomerase SurA
MRRWLMAIASLSCLLLAGHPAGAQQRIVAVVNDDVISAQDLNDRLQLVTLSSGIPDSEEARARLAPQVLRSLIEETLQLQEAERLDITVEDAEIQRTLANIAERNQMTVEAMQRLFAQKGVNLATLLDQVRAQIAWVKVVNRQIVPRVTVTVDQLDMAVEEARRNEGEPEYLLSEIVLPVDSPAQAQVVAQDAARLVQTLREGASFESLARQVSAAASAENAGDVGWIRGSAIPPELRDTLESMRGGEISDPISSPIGYYIFLLRDRRLSQSAAEVPAGNIEVDLAQILLPVDGGATRDAVRGRAAQLRDRLADCTAMAETAAELSTPDSGRLGWRRVGDLPPGLRQAVSTLPVGLVSEPVDGPGGIHLLMVCDRHNPAAESPQRDQIAEQLQRERVDRLARRYLRDLRKDAFVEVRL